MVNCKFYFKLYEFDDNSNIVDDKSKIFQISEHYLCTPCKEDPNLK